MSAAHLRRALNALAPIADAHTPWTPPETLTAAFFPTIPDEATAHDLLWRASLALAPFGDQLSSLAIPGLLPKTALRGTPPDYLSPSLSVHAPQLSSRLIAASEQAALEVDLILVWRFDAAMDPRLRNRRAYLLDDAVFQFASDRWARLSGDAFALTSRTDARSRLIKFDSAQRARRAIVVGTGPSLDDALDNGLISGADDVYLCNSAVRRPDLFSRYTVRAIGLGDPVFHSGPCRMAGALRRDVALRFEESPETVLVCPERDAAIYTRACNLPAERVIPVEVDPDLAPAQTDIWTTPAVPASSNVMTLTLLPLTIGKYEEVAFIGCDGQPPGETGYFWRHSSTAQYASDFDSAFLAHPAFFRTDFAGYAQQHQSTLAEWIALAESRGAKVTSLTPSHILPLSQRFAGAQ